MSAWGVKPFENDEALDGLEDILLTSVDDWLTGVEKDFKRNRFLDVEDGCAVISFSAVLVGFRPANSDDNVWNVLCGQVTGGQVRRLRRLLKFTLRSSRSETYQLWAEAEEFNDWLANVKNLLRQLR